jgi:CheY-like chemotaxis protein
MVVKTVKQEVEAPVTDPMEFKPGMRVLAELSDDRRRLYHTGRRILIVDDSESTCKRLQRQLAPIYDSVEYETDPVKARERIMAAQTSGSAYDAVILDVFMQPIQGGQLLKELHAQGALPAVVFNTGSMLYPFVSDAVNQWDTFKSEKEMETGYLRLREEKHDEPDIMERLARPILFQHKRDEDLEGLVAKIDFAMRLRQDGLGDAGEFLSQFKPMLVEANFPDEVTHKIMEEAVNATREVTAIVHEITEAHPGFTRTPWYTVHGRSFEDTLSKLAHLSFDEVKGEGDVDRAQNLHETANRMVDLRPPEEKDLERQVGVELAKDQGFQRLLTRWREAVSKPEELVSYYHAQYREYLKPELDILKHAKEQVGDRGEVECEYDFVVVPGDKKRLMELASMPVDAAKKRVAANTGSNLKVRVGWIEDASKSEAISEAEKSRLEAIGCKECAVLEVEDTAPAPANVDDAYGVGSNARLVQMEREKIGVWTPETPPGGGLKFRLLLKI